MKNSFKIQDKEQVEKDKLAMQNVTLKDSHRQTTKGF